MPIGIQCIRLQSANYMQRQAEAVLAGHNDPRLLRRMVIEVIQAQGRRRGKGSNHQGRED